MTGFGKQKNYWPFFRLVGEILALWLLITATNFSFVYQPNESDTLPFARQAAEPEWLPNDWFLNLDLGYRQLFDFGFGPVVSWLGFARAAYLGRLGLYLLLAITGRVFFQTLGLAWPYRWLVFVLFLNNQSLIAGEWMVGGVETKSLSYSLVLMAFSFFVQRRYRPGAVCAGAAISFHPLVGTYACFCLAAAVGLNKEWRADWRLMLAQWWLWGLAGLAGLIIIGQQLGNLGNSPAGAIYVLFRNPHHTWPAAWPGYPWLLGGVGVALALFGGFHLSGRSPVVRFTAAYTLGSLGLFLVGLAIFALGQVEWLKYYWFRFADVIVPFMGGSLLVGQGAEWGPVARLGAAGRKWLHLAIIGLIVINIGYHLYQLGQEFKQQESSHTIATLEWIAKNTPPEATFLVDPTMSNFYLYAQRAMFVSWKHIPYRNEDILEWYERIKLANGNRSPAGQGFAALVELQDNFYHLDPAQIQAISGRYAIDYYLGNISQDLPFEPVYQNGHFVLYRLP